MSGRVFGSDGGRGVNGAIVNLLPDNSEATDIVDAAMTTADGSFAFGRVPSGRYTMEVRARGYRVHTEQIRVRPGQSRKLSVRLTASASCPPIVIGQKRPVCP